LGAQGRLEVTNTLEDLSRVAREFRAREITVLAINGGDGTICRTLTAFIKEYGDAPLPSVAVLRGGTINVLASNLGVRGSPEEILFRLTEWHASGEPMPTQRLSTLYVDDTYGFLFGNGTAAAFLKEYYKRKSGPAGAAWWCFRVWASRFFGAQLYDSVVRDYRQVLLPSDAPAVDHTTCAVFASTLPRMPFGVPLFPKVRGNPGRFQVVSFTFAARDAVWQLPIALATRQDGATKGKMSLVTQALDLEADAPFDYTLDGELYASRGKRLAIGMGPDLDFVVI
jgi:diacylglycerol kinase family enzyme